MAKMIKFDLPIDGVKVSTLDELRDHFTAEIVGHFRSGLLAKWLRVRRMTEQLDAVEALTASEDSAILQGLCDLFEIEADATVISAAVLAESIGVSVGGLAKALQIPAEVLLAYLERSGSNQKTRDSIVSNKEKIELIRHLITPALRDLRTISLGEISEGRIAIVGECEAWVFEIPCSGKFHIVTQAEFDYQRCLFGSSGRVFELYELLGKGDVGCFTYRLRSGVYFFILGGTDELGGTDDAIGTYSLQVRQAFDDAATSQEGWDSEESDYDFCEMTGGLPGSLAFAKSMYTEHSEYVYHPFLIPLTVQLAVWAKSREGNVG